MSRRQLGSPPSIPSKIFMDNKGKLPNNFVALEDTTFHCEHQLEVPLFQPPQPHDHISSSCSHGLCLDYDVSSYSYLLIKCFLRA